MIDWLLIIIALGAHGKMDQITVSRHTSIEICESAGVKEIKRFKGRAAFTCFQAAPLPSGKKRLEPVLPKSGNVRDEMPVK